MSPRRSDRTDGAGFSPHCRSQHERRRNSEKLAMNISGHNTRSVFEPYNITDERDVHDAGEKLTTYLAKQPKRKREVVTAKVTKRTEAGKVSKRKVA